MSKVFSVNAWRFAVGPPTSGKWDRFTSWGVKVKDGEESIFNEENLGQMVENFGNRKNDLAMCYDHQSAYVAENGQPAPALAFYCALALVVDGKVVKFATHDSAVAPLDPAGLENGVYGYRSEITQLGEKLLPNYKFLSPMFTTDGADESGNPIGYDLFDVAATNTPFQDGVALTFHRGADRPHKERYGMDKELMKRLGLAEDASADEARGAMASQLAKFYAAEDEAAKKMADEEKAKDAEKMADDKPADEEKKEDDKKEMADDKAAAEKMADDPDEDDKKAMAKALGLGNVVSLSALRHRLLAKLDYLEGLEKFRADYLLAEAKLKAEQEAADAKRLTLEVDTFVSDAVGNGQWPEDKQNNLASIYRKDPAEAKAVLFKKGTFTHVLKTYRKDLPERAADSADVRTKKGPVAMGADFSAKAQAYAKENKVSLGEAQIAVAKAHPDLYKAYKLGE